MCILVIGVTVIELGDTTLANGFTEGAETAWFFRDGHSNDGFALFTQLCPTADDIWFKAMTLRSGLSSRVINENSNSSGFDGRYRSAELVVLACSVVTSTD